ncbi:hypothetical protein BDN72DRAFT_72816 [Pluteus cervinus]|uniref:Uncharacterized protein n=1 Tax=Pluteus cervinus TaxID=181527 RepID=A0ACD3AQ94_9AGAR|nr:hypothetical protein BDN72DRAFT_72816 [Pluteus cervinus]
MPRSPHAPLFLFYFLATMSIPTRVTAKALVNLYSQPPKPYSSSGPFSFTTSNITGTRRMPHVGAASPPLATQLSITNRRARQLGSGIGSKTEFNQWSLGGYTPPSSATLLVHHRIRGYKTRRHPSYSAHIISEELRSYSILIRYPGI